jgi:hypothetical protein
LLREWENQTAGKEDDMEAGDLREWISVGYRNIGVGDLKYHVARYLCLLELPVHAVMEYGSSSNIVPFCKTYVGAELASLHYTTFIEPLVVVPAEPLSVGSKTSPTTSHCKQYRQTRSWSWRTSTSPSLRCIRTCLMCALMTSQW